jgi:hypothetical protein
MTFEDACKILGVSRSAQLPEIRAAYYRRAKECHPDVTGTVDFSQFLLVRAAYEFLLRRLSTDYDPEVDSADLDAEWKLREQVIRRRFGELRRVWKKRPLTEQLLARLRSLVGNYGTVSGLRDNIKKDVTRSVANHVKELTRDLHSDVRKIAARFTSDVNRLYFPFVRRLRLVRKRSVLWTPGFWLLSAGSAVAASAIVLLTPQYPPAVATGVAGVGLLLSYAGTRLVLGRPLKQFVRLDVPVVREVVESLQAPASLTKEDLVKGGLLLAAIDWLVDSDLEELAVIGAGLALLSVFFGKSLERVKADTIAEIEKTLPPRLNLELELMRLLDTYEDRLVATCYQSYKAGRRRALEYATRYTRPLLSQTFTSQEFERD